MMQKDSSYLITLILLITFLFPSGPSANWAYSFVVWDGYTYVISDEYVESIDREIGHVTKYSGNEGTYYGNFSNTYKKGTKYYSIKGISTDEAIAVKEDDGRYRKATMRGEYAGGKCPIFGLKVSALVIGLLAILLIVFGINSVEKRVRK